MKKIQSDTVVIAGRISPQLQNAIDQVLEAGLYVNETDFLREAIREKLEKINMSGLRRSQVENGARTDAS